MITKEQLQAFIPVLTGPTADPYQDIADALNATCDKYEINTSRRVRYFITETAFECNYYHSFKENMHYSRPDRLVAVWPSHFTMDQTKVSDHLAYAPDYVNDPEKLGNFVYANRNGNGDVASGDGYNYCGRGALGLTGKDNYAKCSQDSYGDDRLVQHPELVEEYGAGIMSAGWFWHTRALNQLADLDDFTKVTGIINGSTVTVPQRILVLNKVNSIF